MSVMHTHVKLRRTSGEDPDPFGQVSEGCCLGIRAPIKTFHLSLRRDPKNLYRWFDKDFDG
jgi:hypothetical protein